MSYGLKLGWGDLYDGMHRGIMGDLKGTYVKM